MLTSSLGTLLAILAVTPLVTEQARSPGAALDELLAADRAFSSAASKGDLDGGISAMFADTVIAPLPGGRFAEGREAVVAALRESGNGRTTRAEWTPVRGGISADGQHGFTFGHMIVHRERGAPEPAKYLAYWVKQPPGWRVAVYKRSGAAAGPVTPAMSPSLPDRMVAPSNDAAALARHRESLAAAERAFSNEAQQVGLGAAFAKFGRPDAMNLGGPGTPGFVIGAEAIARAVSEGTPATSSPLSWGPDKGVIVASSGDLGVTIGIIRRNAPPTDPKQPSTFAFFTIWRRDSPAAPWRYIAE